MIHDFKTPDYSAIFNNRLEALNRIRANPDKLPALKAFYKEHPAQFITDWGCTFDAKNVELGLPALIPFILFEKQTEWVDKVVENWKAGKPLLTLKTRQMGFSWLAMAVACTLCLFYDGMTIGFGSRLEEYVDNLGDMKALFPKGRVFLSHLPVEFRGGFDIGNKAHSSFRRFSFPETSGSIVGEAGDNIGRGATTSIYFVDESAFLARPQMIEASLSQTTNCRVDISTPNGSANPFAEKFMSGKIDTFTFHWRDDPRKDDEWYRQQCEELDAVTIAQELDCDFSASVEGLVIPPSWVRSAIDANYRLGVEITGVRSGALDVADEGKDLNAFCGRHGILLEYIDEWSGKNGDIFKTTEKAFDICETFNYESFKFDSDGLGAGVRGDATRINLERKQKGRRQFIVEPFRGSESPLNPEREDVKSRKNKDYFANRKAQEWWALRRRFERTFLWVTEGIACSPDEIISIKSGIKHLDRLIRELSQPTYDMSAAGKIVVDKSPAGTKSPNLADAIMMAFAKSGKTQMRINSAVLDYI